MDQKDIAAWNREHVCLHKHYESGKKANDEYTCVQPKDHSGSHSDGKKAWVS